MKFTQYYKKSNFFKLVSCLINLVAERRTFDPVTGVRFPHGVNFFLFSFFILRAIKLQIIKNDMNNNKKINIEGFLMITSFLM